MTGPLLTVFLLTYNQEKTIRDTLQGIFSQSTTYPFVVKILDDASSDNTVAICKEYVNKYADQCMLIAQPVNTAGEHFRWALNTLIETPYFTIIEGDDYWTSPFHLQHAIDFLQAHADYNLYASNVLHTHRNYKKNSCEIMSLSEKQVKSELSFENYIYVQTSGRVYRHIFDFKQFPVKTVEFDIFLYYLYLDHGKCFFNSAVESVYRISEKGVWTGLSEMEQKNKMFEVVYTAANLLACRHAGFLVQLMPKCAVKKCRKILGSYLTLKLFIFLENFRKRIKLSHG